VDEARKLADGLAEWGITALTIAWADNNGIPRSRSVPLERLPEVAARGVGITSLFAVFDSHDMITYAHPGLSTPSGDIRLVPVLDRVTRLAGQPSMAWAPGRQLAADGGPWPYDQRGVLERQVAQFADVGLDALVGYEIEFAVGLPGDAFVPAHPGPAYSPHALLAVDEFVAAVFADFDANGLPINQLHAEYGPAQVELSLTATDPVTSADRQLLARQTLHAAARAHGLRLSFAPLVVPEAAGNGWHLHVSVWRDGRNLLRAGDDPAAGPAGEGAAFLAGVLRELPAVAALTAPSVPSLARLRPGYFAGAYQFWGVENREAALRYVPGSALLGADHANLELKVSDASANPYLALAAVLDAGLAGLRDGAVPPEPVAEDPGGWPAQRRAERNIPALPATPEEQEKALLSSSLPARVLGEPLLGAFLAARRSDAAWARDRDLAEVLAAHRWRY